VAAAQRLGYPVVVKTGAPNVLHKSETGQVFVNLDSAPAVRSAARAVQPPILVQPYIAGGVEFIVGLENDPALGTCIVVGAGGVLAEVLDRVAVRAVPLRSGEAEEMLADLSLQSLLDGYRGRSPVNRSAVARRSRGSRRSERPWDRWSHRSISTPSSRRRRASIRSTRSSSRADNGCAVHPVRVRELRGLLPWRWEDAAKRARRPSRRWNSGRRGGQPAPRARDVRKDAPGPHPRHATAGERAPARRVAACRGGIPNPRRGASSYRFRSRSTTAAALRPGRPLT